MSALIGRTYTAADRAALPDLRHRRVLKIAEARDESQADFYAAEALASAAVWIEQGEVVEALELIREANVARRARLADLAGQVSR